ncbi:unnamed protein product [Dicrocoelium dendriticum]|nr:unnamed protein product [Dicrocoelium dendriticum]
MVSSEQSQFTETIVCICGHTSHLTLYAAATLTTAGCVRQTNSRAFVIDVLLSLLLPMVII